MKLCSSNKRLIKELIRGLNLLSYNKKEIINRTWMGEPIYKKSKIFYI
jgi:hypothetical protein